MTEAKENITQGLLGYRAAKYHGADLANYLS